MSTHSITYGNKTIEFEVQRKNVKNSNLNIRPDMTIAVSSNNKVPLEDILNFVKNKAPWIFKNLGYFKDVQPEHSTDKEYVSG